MITAAHRQLDPSAALHSVTLPVDIEQLIESQHLGHGTSQRCDSSHAVLPAPHPVLPAPHPVLCAVAVCEVAAPCVCIIVRTAHMFLCVISTRCIPQ